MSRKLKKSIKFDTYLNIQDKNGKTALIIASCHGYLSTVELLLDVGVNIDTKDETGKTALIYASTEGHLENVETLLDAGADFNIRERQQKGNKKKLSLYWLGMSLLNK